WNVKSVSAMCAKCVMIDKHDLCVLKSVAKPLKKTVTFESIKKNGLPYHPTRRKKTISKHPAHLNLGSGPSLFHGPKALSIDTLDADNSGGPRFCLYQAATAPTSIATAWRSSSLIRTTTNQNVLQIDI
nr:hypothetical protein [Tanacetum cinerariifolium]